MSVLEYFKGKFTFDIEDNVIKTAVLDRVGVWEDDMTLDALGMFVEQSDLIVADIIMAYYRTPNGLSKDFSAGDFSVTLRSDKRTFGDIAHLYQYAQSIYKKYDDLAYEGEELNVLSV